MKKQLAILLTLCMVLSLAACGSTSEPAATTTATQPVLETEPVQTTEAVPETEAAVIEEEKITLESLKATFALKIETEGLSADELYAMGQQYENGDGVVQWYGMAMAYYEAAKAAGSEDAPEAINALNAFKEDMMSEETSPNGQGWIFDFFRAGVSAGQLGDFETAYAVNHDDVFFFEDPLVRGLDELAGLISKGGDEEDIGRAMAIYRYTAEVLGKGKSYSALGMLYEAEDGTYPGVSHSMDTAMDYYAKAYQLDSLSQKDGKAPRYLADIYAEGYTMDDGTVVEPDYAKAAEYYAAAVELGDTTSSYSLAVYYQNGTGVEQDYAKSAEYYLQALVNSHATQLGIPQTYLALGQYYENGLGVEQDNEKAIEYYTSARDAAQENLDKVNVGASNLDMEGIRDEAIEALERLGAAQ